MEQNKINNQITERNPLRNKQNKKYVTTVITDSLGKVSGSQLSVKAACVYVKLWADINPVYKDIQLNNCYIKSDNIVLLCGKNSIQTNTRRTIIEYKHVRYS